MHKSVKFLEILEAIETFLEEGEIKNAQELITMAKDLYNIEINAFELSERPDNEKG